MTNDASSGFQTDVPAGMSIRAWLVFLFDLLAPVVAWLGAFPLRFNLEWPVLDPADAALGLTPYQSQMLLGLMVLLPAHALACRWAGLYRGLWIFASLPDLKRVLLAVVASTFVLLTFVVLYQDGVVTPRSILLLYPMLLIGWMGGGRLAYRIFKEYRLHGGLRGEGDPVVIVGAGRAGAALVREFGRSARWRVVGFVDDDRAKWGREVLGKPVFGGIDLLPRIVPAHRVEHVILSVPASATDARRRAVSMAVQAGARVLTLPAIEDLMSGRVTLSSMRPIEIDDLLGRETVEIDSGHVAAMVAGKVVMVTGAGGSIGSELCRQLARYQPARLVLFEQGEYALYQLQQWFAEHRPELVVNYLAGDVKDGARLEEVFSQWRPDLVFHAAAYKHVPLMEVGNAWQAVRNNVLGTIRVADCACRHVVDRFILISTDKAVNPTNVMGATKRLAEMVCEALSASGSRTVFTLVRFGNVLGSTGSVIPKFQSQIESGGPLTVTHPEITRYFMSIAEAAQLVLQAAEMGSGGQIFVLDMGKPVRILDLARNMIRLSGRTEDEIRIEFTGLRPGEKLYEELLADSEQTCETPHPKLRIARNRPVPQGFLGELRAWLVQERPLTDDAVRLALSRWIAEYAPLESRRGLRLVSGVPTRASEVTTATKG
jgi:FlaA1/EpsC-like NDP-sugar epimerase